MHLGRRALRASEVSGLRRCTFRIAAVSIAVQRSVLPRDRRVKRTTAFDRGEDSNRNNESNYSLA